MRSQVNASRIVRAAGCFGVTKILLAGHVTLDDSIARDAIGYVDVKQVRTLGPALKKTGAEGYRLVGLEQTTNSVSIYDFKYPRKAVLVIGNERTGIEPEILRMLDEVVEIPVYGQPHSFNAATSAAIAMYEYCRQYPSG